MANTEIIASLDQTRFEIAEKPCHRKLKEHGLQSCSNEASRYSILFDKMDTNSKKKKKKKKKKNKVCKIVSTKLSI